MLSKQTDEYQTKLISRIWQRVGIKAGDLDDEVVGEIFAEWKDALSHLGLDQIKRGVEYWSEREGTPSPEMFIGSCLSKVKLESFKKKENLTKKQVMEKATKLAGEDDQTFEEAYRFLNLHQRWGKLDRRVE